MRTRVLLVVGFSMAILSLPVVLSSLAIESAPPDTELPPMELGQLALVSGLTALFLVGLGALGRALTRRVPLATRWWGPARAYPATALAAVGASIIGGSSAHLIGLDFGEGYSFLTDSVGQLDGPQLLATCTVLALFPALSEELFFRGWMLGTLRAVVSPSAALFASAAAFACMHGTPGHAWATFPIGLVLGFAVLRTQALGPAVFAHAFNNFVAVAAADTPAELASTDALASLGLGLLLLSLGLAGLRGSLPVEADEAATEPAPS